MIAQDRPDGTEACPDNLNVEPFLAAAQLNSTAGRRRMARHPPRPTLPADAASVAGFFDRRRVVALTRRAAAIAAKHREKGFSSPAADPAVTAILCLARRDATPPTKPLRRMRSPLTRHWRSAITAGGR